MKKYKYLIVGGGMTADSAARKIRLLDHEGSIGLFSEEPDFPYRRPPLSKKLWGGESIEKIWCHTEQLGVEIHLNESIVAIDKNNKAVKTRTNIDFGYEKLLLATGGTPRKLNSGEGLINYFRTLQDYLALKADVESATDFIVIGGGFIGSEIASALCMNGKSVSMIFMEGGINARNLPDELSHFVTDYYRKYGIKIFPNSSIVRVEKKNDKIAVIFKDSQNKESTLLTQKVVAGLGIIPNTQLALSSGLKNDNGVNVNTYLQTEVPNIFSAGDVANYFDPILKTQRRVEHADNAYAMGSAAGINMVGEMKPWNYLPFFYSDLFNLGYEAVGELDSRLETYSDWQEPFKKGVIYYLKDRRIRGVLLWNVWDRVPTAREIISTQKVFSMQDLNGLIR